eukprot:CAMPEP_0203757192 /NCGR_PEP_ID=MMETSP0098-20131031/10323_1 /ASSEMBLY_ACC=CAM_ASM_000208 /TAXON_ID=96639 /ORGANISM=" , Strain NY0313808BC1" /LENGTH=429 /DNA_ID=CAMNT_0050649337 /DNA_START=74 /DNA_END=1363 /DNA_ORIENTATION=-
MSTGSRAFKLKRNACETCYKGRVKCEYDGDSKTCKRCTRQHKVCIPRVIVRGTGFNSKRDEDDSKDPTCNLTHIDLDAYRSSKIFEDLPHISMSYNAAFSVIKTYKSLGLVTPPPSFRWIINSRFLVALAEKSTSMLHTSTTLAMSSGIDVPVDLISNRLANPVSLDVRNSIEAEIHHQYLDNKEAGPCFIVRVINGVKSVIAATEFEHMFSKGSDMSRKLTNAAHLSRWREFIVDQNQADKFVTKIMKAWLLAGDPVTPHTHQPSRIGWSTCSDKPVQVKDNQGNLYTATLFERGIMFAEGSMSYLVFGFQNLTPSDEGARNRCKRAVDTSRPYYNFTLCPPTKPQSLVCPSVSNPLVVPQTMYDPSYSVNQILPGMESALYTHPSNSQLYPTDMDREYTAEAEATSRQELSNYASHLQTYKLENGFF